MEIIAISRGKALPLLALQGSDSEQSARSVLSGIRKKAISTRDQPYAVQIHALGIEGDEQADLSVHGGLDKAIYAYPSEHYPVWQTLRLQALKRDELLEPGFLGENLTIAGLLENEVWVGDVLVFAGGEVRLRVTSSRSPCYKFNTVMGFKQAALMMNQSGYTGFYLEVIQQGRLRAGERFELAPGDRYMRIDELHRMNQRKR